MKARIRGVDVNMRTFDYIFGAYLGELILGHSDNLSKTLQNPDLSAVDGHRTATATVNNLRNIRSEGGFNMFWDKILIHANRLDVDKPKLPRRKAPPKSLESYSGYGKGSEAVHDSPKDLYRKHYFEALDAVINCIDDRFEQEDFKIYAQMEQVLLRPYLANNTRMN